MITVGIVRMIKVWIYFKDGASRICCLIEYEINEFKFSVYITKSMVLPGGIGLRVNIKASF